MRRNRRVRRPNRNKTETMEATIVSHPLVPALVGCTVTGTWLVASRGSKVGSPIAGIVVLKFWTRTSRPVLEARGAGDLESVTGVLKTPVTLNPCIVIRKTLPD